MADFIAYYRVSTDRQGASGLGLDAQRQAVAGFIGTGQLVAEFTEIESGRRHTNRPQLLAALAECRKRRAVLLIARLDRLARNVAFISALMENGTDFIACDMPQASRLTIHILAAVVSHTPHVQRVGFPGENAKFCTVGEPERSPYRKPSS